MRRRDLLKLIVSGVVGHTLDIDRLLWEPNRKTIFLPTDAQVIFFNRKDYPALYGVPYHQSNASSGTWLGITRSVEPWPWRQMLDRLTIDPKKPLIVIDE